ncbi:MAG: NADH-ubiquinone oxidoreductase [Deltaproteobacteria bacterium]|nr:NADH-ubiquinone oxidoreductase [Deltaproteobacteria bacterium]
MISTDIQAMGHALFLSLVTGTPLLMAAACCTPMKKTVARFLPLAAVPAFVIALTAPVDLVAEIGWFFMGGRMGLDEIGRIFLCLSAFIWFLASFSSRSLLKHHQGCQNYYLFFFLISMSGNFGLILARGLLGYYLFFALMSFAAYGLVIQKGTEEARKAGRIYLILVMIGEIALFTALIILAHKSGSLAIDDIAGVSYQPLVLALLFIGFGVKIGALPLHGWMIPAYQAAPIPAAAALAGAMVNAGILGWLRFLPPGLTFCPQGAALFIAAGALAAVYGVITGLNHKQAGAVLGCSSISQMGLITVIFGLGLLDHDAGSQATPVLVLYVVHHSLAKSSLFFGYDFAASRGRMLSHLQMAAILLPALALAGLPLTGGAIAKSAFKELTVTLGEPWYELSTFFLPITAMGTTMLMLHFICVLKRTEQSGNSDRAGSGIVFTVSFIATAITLWLWPAAGIFVSHSLAGIKLWQAFWPVGGGCLLFLAWRRFFSREKPTLNDQTKDTTFDTILFTIVNLLQEKEWQTPQQGKFLSYLSGFVPQLRRSEKIMGRWKVVGLSYLLLCLCLLFWLL